MMLPFLTSLPSTYPSPTLYLYAFTPSSTSHRNTQVDYVDEVAPSLRLSLSLYFAAAPPPPPPPPNKPALYRQFHQIILRTATVRMIDTGGGVWRSLPLPPSSRVPRPSSPALSPPSPCLPPVALCPACLPHGSAFCIAYSVSFCVASPHPTITENAVQGHG